MADCIVSNVFIPFNLFTLCFGFFLMEDIWSRFWDGGVRPLSGCYVFAFLIIVSRFPIHSKYMGGVVSFILFLDFRSLAQSVKRLSCTLLSVLISRFFLNGVTHYSRWEQHLIKLRILGIQPSLSYGFFSLVRSHAVSKPSDRLYEALCRRCSLRIVPTDVTALGRKCRRNYFRSTHATKEDLSTFETTKEDGFPRVFNIYTTTSQRLAFHPLDTRSHLSGEVYLTDYYVTLRRLCSAFNGLHHL